MHKVSNKSKIYKKILQFYKKNDEKISIDRVFDQYINNTISEKTINKKWKSFFKFFLMSNNFSIVSVNILNTLKYHYGKHDIKYTWNRDYHGWVLEHQGVFFIVGSNSSYVVPDDPKIIEQLPDILISFYYELFKMTVDYLDNHPHTMKIDELVEKWRKKGIVIGNNHKSLVKIKK